MMSLKPWAPFVTTIGRLEEVVNLETLAGVPALGDRQMRIYPLTLPSPPLFPLRGAVERGQLNLPIALACDRPAKHQAQA